MGKIEKILNKVEDIKIENISTKYTFRLSVYYFIRTIIFLAILASSIFLVISKNENPSILIKLLIAVLSLYIIYSLYVLLSYKFVIENNKLIIKGTVIDLTKLTSLKLANKPIANGKYDLCLNIIEQDDNSKLNEFNVRLNISNMYLFIALISKISKLKVSE